MILSGLRATVIMEGEGVLDEEKVKASIEGKGMGLKSIEQVELAPPKDAYVLSVSGAT